MPAKLFKLKIVWLAVVGTSQKQKFSAKQPGGLFRGSTKKETALYKSTDRKRTTNKCFGLYLHWNVHLMLNIGQSHTPQLCIWYTFIRTYSLSQFSIHVGINNFEIFIFCAICNSFIGNPFLFRNLFSFVVYNK